MDDVLYDTKEMIEVLEQTHIPGDFFLNTFVRETKFHTSKIIEIDIVKHGKKMAPFQTPVREGVVIDRERFNTRQYEAPYIKPKRSMTSQEFLQRLPGNTVYAGQTSGSMVDKLMGKDLAELDQMIFRNEEWMACRGVQDGQLHIQGEGVDYIIDFGMLATHKPILTGAATWDETTADIDNDLTTWADIIYDDSGLSATHVILGRDAKAAMMSNAAFIGTLDRRRIERGEINVKRLPKGVRYYGTHNESGLDIYGYVEKFWDETTQGYKDLIDPKAVLVGSDQSMFIRHYGAIQNVNTNFIGARYPSNWITKDPAVAWVMVESAPLVVPHQIDAWLVATVLP